MFFDRRTPRAPSAPSRSLPRDVWRLMISRSPISRDANWDVPPFSLPAQRRMSVFPQPCERILEAVDRPQRIQLIDDEPKALILIFVAVHCLEYGKPHPRRDHGTQRCNLV